MQPQPRRTFTRIEMVLDCAQQNFHHRFASKGTVKRIERSRINDILCVQDLNRRREMGIKETNPDAMIFENIIVKFLQSLRRLWIIANLREMDAELIEWNSLLVKVSRCGDYLFFWVVS